MPRTLEFKGSSNLKSATLGDDGVLEVAFQNGTTSRFGNVTQAMMDEWSAAESGGRWFHNNVRSRPKDYPNLSAGSPPASSPAPASPSSAAPAEQPIPTPTSEVETAPIKAPEGVLAAPASVGLAAAPTAPAPEAKRGFRPWRPGAGTPPWRANREKAGGE